MLSEFSVSYGLLAAGCTIAMIPPVIIFAYIQKFLVGGLASGAVKVNLFDRSKPHCLYGQWGFLCL